MDTLTKTAKVPFSQLGITSTPWKKAKKADKPVCYLTGGEPGGRCDCYACGVANKAEGLYATTDDIYHF